MAGRSKIGADLLVAADVVEPRYYQSDSGMRLNSTARTLCSHLALGNAAWSPGRGKLRKLVCAGDAESRWSSTTKITIRWISSSPGGGYANTHCEVGIMQIVNLFEDAANFDCLRACRTEQEVLISLTAPTRQLKKELNMSLPMLQVAGQPNYG